MPNDRTIVDVFEEVLGVPFDPLWTKQVSIDVPTARRLAKAVKDFYNNFCLPEKELGEMRPYLFHRYAAGISPWRSFVGYKGVAYTFTPSHGTDIFGFLKPFLLYSHGICFYDPLTGLLDYFDHSSEDTDKERARLPGVANLLFEYVRIAELIRHRIVIPISGEAFGDPYARNNFTLSDSEKREIINLFSANPRYQDCALLVDYVGSLVKEQLWLKQHTENRIDLYFPDDFCVPILQGLLRAASRRYTSREITEPFTAGILAELACLDTSQISITDVISVRSEHAFDEYRGVLRRILRRLQEQEGNFSDVESEFKATAREAMAECDDKIKQLTKKSNVLRDTFRSLDRVLIGGALGSLGGLLAGSPEIAVSGATAGAALRPVYDILRGAWTASPSPAVRASLRNHFLVLDPQNFGRRP